MLHKIEKALMLETDVSETANEMIKSVRKMGSCGVIAAYAGYTNHFNSECPVRTTLESFAELTAVGWLCSQSVL